MIRILLRYDASFQCVSFSTPLHICALQNSENAFSTLLGLGADLNVLNPNNRTALHLCAPYSNFC